MQTIVDVLKDQNTYHNIISDYCQKLIEHDKRPKIAALLQTEGPELAKNIAAGISEENFEFSVVQQTRLRKGARKKLYFLYEIIDLIVLKALLAALAPVFAKRCSPNLYSFIKNRNTKQPIEHYRKFLELHRRQNNGCVDLWIYKTDIHHFYESIPVHSQSIIWSKLNELLLAAPLGDDASGYIKNLYATATRPNFKSMEQNFQANLIGIPYGSPFSPLLGNLYLTDMDFNIAKIPDLFYARYADDILIAHADKEVLLAAANSIKEEVYKVGLSFATIKEKWVYYTHAGRAAADNSQRFKGSNKIHFLGFIVHPNGKTHATHKIVHRFLTSCHKKIAEANTLEDDMTVSKRGEIICSSLQKLLSPDVNLQLKELLFRTNDHDFLIQLDHRIALWIVEALTATTGKQAFRQVPYRVLRDQWHLPSLVTLRNSIRC